MIQNLSTISGQFLTNLQLLQQRTATTEAQLSSGTTLSKPSDNPGELGDVLQLEAHLSSVTQVSNNLSAVTGEVNTAEGALSNATSLLQQVQTLASQGAGSTATASTRTELSQQVQQLLGQLVSSANTTYNGQYVFGGDQSGTAPYQVDLNNPNGVDRLSSAPSTRLIQDATGVTFAVSKTAQDIFDHRNADDSLAPDNVFAAVNSLRVALAANDSTGINNAITSLGSSADYLSQQLGFYGGVQDQVQNATDVASKFQLQYQTSLSAETATNTAQAATDLTLETSSQQAALQAEASMPKTSLFSYLSGTSG